MNFYKAVLPFKYKCLLAAAMVCGLVSPASAQQKKAYFIDGYHGGIWGHYPVWNTRFMADMLKNNPQWKINIELEPETWDDAQIKDPEAYKDFQNLLADQSAAGMRIEYVNPGYAQAYTYNISGESIIRQFKYGIKKIKQHFPTAQFSTYSSEEPCFTSALPQILSSFGFKYASLKNPNTCWGGYTRAFGGEVVTWIGSDGSKLVTVPRYATEKLLPGSTWQTNAFYNDAEYINDAFAYGIEHPVGMTLQDAGWRNGLYLGKGNRSYQPTEYTTWRNYFENVAIKTPTQDWKLSQEDVLVSLVWGSQVMQRLAQQVRFSENKIIMAEKIAAINKVYNGTDWPVERFDSAWRTLLLSQHHDCWIVPYNGRPGNTWADKVVTWTANTNYIADSTIRAFPPSQAPTDFEHNFVKVYNTLGTNRSEWVTVDVPMGMKTENVVVYNSAGSKVPSQIVINKLPFSKALYPAEYLIKKGFAVDGTIMFKASVPAFGYSIYSLKEIKNVTVKGKLVKQQNGKYIIETDLYTITINPAKGGVIESLIAKKLNNKEFVDKANERGFNEMRGNFSKEGGFLSSKNKPAVVTIVEDGPLQAKVQIKGTIGAHQFTQLLAVAQGQQRIDLQVKIDYNGSPEIGEPTAQGAYKATDYHKGFYNDREKLMALFPLNLKGQKVYKNAPYDVTESKLENTFFTRWDSIKNNVLLNWVDITDKDNAYGLALFTDHTTNYAHGQDFPLGLTLQYSGVGLWGRNYKIDGPTVISYSLLPHAGKWDKAGVETESKKWNEPLVASLQYSSHIDVKDTRSLLNVQGTGYEVSSVTFEGKDMLVRLFNAESDNIAKKLAFNFKADKAAIVELNGEEKEELKMVKNAKGQSSVLITMPRFGLRTIKFTNAAKTG